MKSWLFTVAYRTYIDYYRKHKGVIVTEQERFATIVDKKRHLLDDLVTKEQVEEILTLLDRLPDKHKYAVLLHDFHGLSQREAAEVMNIQQSHFKVLLFRGRSAIRRRKVEENE